MCAACRFGELFCVVEHGLDALGGTLEYRFDMCGHVLRLCTSLRTDPVDIMPRRWRANTLWCWSTAKWVWPTSSRDKIIFRSPVFCSNNQMVKRQLVFATFSLAPKNVQTFVKGCGRG